MPNIHIEIKNRIAYANKEDFVVGGNDDYSAIFTFDEEWKDVETKTARFSWGFDNMHDEVFVGNECKVPRITNATMLKIGIFIGNKRATTDAIVPCKISTVDNNGMPQDPLDDVYTQILKKLDQAIGEQTAVPEGGKKGQVLTKGSDKDFDTEWSDGGSGGGTNVEANPTEEATEDLSKLKVGDKVYDVVDKTELDKKIDKDTSTSTYSKVYIKNPQGNQQLITTTHLNSQGFIPSYASASSSTVGTEDKGGTFAVAMPKQPYQAAPMKYVDDKFNGANKAVSFVNYSSMITSLNSLASTSYNVGQNVMIVTLNVPDLWISEIAETSVPYTYVSDDDFVSALETNGYVQIGYFKLSALETQKVDLTEYVKQTQIAQLNGDYGLIKLNDEKYGLKLFTDGSVILNAADKRTIEARNSYFRPLPTAYLPYIVKLGLIEPNVGLTKGDWTEEDQAKARKTLGITSGGGSKIYKHTFTCEQYYDGNIDGQINGWFYSTISTPILEVAGNALITEMHNPTILQSVIGDIHVYNVQYQYDKFQILDEEHFIFGTDGTSLENLNEVITEV